MRALVQRWQAWRQRPRRVCTPVLLQMEAAECGAAALRIVLAYYGRRLPLETLRAACDVNRDGTSAARIVQAAQQYGLKAKGFRKTPQTLRAMRLPLIIHWNFNNFLVLEGFSRHGAHVNDPGSGRYTVSEAEFAEAFTGVVLAFEPGPDFRRCDERPGLFALLAPHLRHVRAALLFVFLASLALVLPGLLLPTFIQVFVDHILIGQQLDWGVPLLLLLAGVALLAAGLTGLQERYRLRLENKLAVVLSGRFLWHVLHLPLTFYQQRYPGEIAARTAINDRVAHLLAQQAAALLLALLTAGFFLALIAVLDGYLALIALSAALLQALLAQLYRQRLIDDNRRLLQEAGKLQGVTVAALQGMDTLKVAGGEDDSYARWAGHFAKTLNSQQRMALDSNVLVAGPLFLSMLANALVLVVGALRVMEGALTLGGLVAVQVLLMQFLRPLERLVGIGQLWQQAVGDLNRVEDVLRYPALPVAATATGAEPVQRLQGRLELRGIHFGYSRHGPPLLAGLDLTLEPGQRVALVGGSGSGKSTLARIVAGLLPVSAGHLYLDGQPASAWPGWLRTAALALVEQEVVLFDGTVRDNLTLWDSTIPDSELIRAARDAAIHDDIMARNGGYDSPVSEGGRNFSGGQRQRLDIARALAQNPSVLILDEATSALDAVTEQQVMENIRRRGCTCLIIAHRLSTVRDCDVIMVMEQGRIVEQGSHADLLAQNGRYAGLVRDP